MAGVVKKVIAYMQIIVGTSGFIVGLLLLGVFSQFWFFGLLLLIIGCILLYKGVDILKAGVHYAITEDTPENIVAAYGRYTPLNDEPLTYTPSTITPSVPTTMDFPPNYTAATLADLPPPPYSVLHAPLHVRICDQDNIPSTSSETPPPNYCFFHTSTSPILPDSDYVLQSGTPSLRVGNSVQDTVASTVSEIPPPIYASIEHTLTQPIISIQLNVSDDPPSFNGT